MWGAEGSGADTAQGDQQGQAQGAVKGGEAVPGIPQNEGLGGPWAGEKLGRAGLGPGAAQTRSQRAAPRCGGGITSIERGGRE